MKKIFKTMLAVAIAAFTFTSCEDVPEPYQIPGMGNDDPNTEIIGGEGDGTEANPYDITAATAVGTGTSVYVKGFIVGYISGKSFDGAVFGADTCTVKTNLLIAASATETNKSKCMPVQLPTGVIRTGLNLADNKDNLGKEVVLCGNIEKYFSQTGIKTVTYATINGEVVGNKPGVGPSGEAKGDGTLENPFNSVAANAYVSSLPADTESDKDFYIKGKVVSVTEQFSTQYGNATFYISDSGTSTDQFYIFRTLYLGNKKYTGEGENIKAGDEVIICGKVVNYYGNTPETVVNKSYIYSLNGKTESTGTPETPDTPDTPDNPSTGDNPGTGDEGGSTDGASVTLIPSEMGYSNAQDMTTITLSDGTTLTFDAGGNQNGPKYYNIGKGIRMYPKNSMKVSSSKKIASIVMTVDVYNGETYNASGDLQANPGTTAVSDNIVTFGGINNQECTITNTSTTTGAQSQVRMTQLKIVYAE